MSICQAFPPAPGLQSCCDLSSPEAQAVLVMRACAEDSSPQLHQSILQPRNAASHLPGCSTFNGAAPGKLPTLSLAASVVGLLLVHPKLCQGHKPGIQWVSPTDSAK